jgi:hypothetical protein
VVHEGELQAAPVTVKIVAAEDRNQQVGVRVGAGKGGRPGGPGFDLLIDEDSDVAQRWPKYIPISFMP